MKDAFVNVIWYDGLRFEVYHSLSGYYIYDKHGCLNTNEPFIQEPTLKTIKEWLTEGEESVYM